MTACCSLIRQYERVVWNYLTSVFSFGLKASEIGFTNDLIYRIVKFYGGRPLGCEVYAFNEDVKEHLRGADIDLFIEENGTGNYYHFMLQAKIISNNGRYNDIEPWSTRAQFYKLIRAAHREGATPLYLFYNGNTRTSSLIPGWGLSIVKAQDVKNFRLAQKSLLRKPKPTGDDLYARSMKAFYVLFCDLPDDLKSRTTINGSNIYKGHPYFRISRRSEPKEDVVALDQDSAKSIQERSLARFRIIINSESSKLD